MIHDISVTDVTKTQRDQAKGLCYGMGVESMARKLGIPSATATTLRSSILKRFGGVQQFIDNTTRTGRSTHYVETMSGRRRLLATGVGEVQSRSDRQAVNSVIQGSAADLLKCAMLYLWGPLERRGCYIIVQIHDELIVDCPKDEGVIEDVVKLLQDGMCQQAKNMLMEIHKKNHPEVIFDFDVPLEQSVSIGDNMAFNE